MAGYNTRLPLSQSDGFCEGFSDANHPRTGELSGAQASEKRQGRKSRGGAAVQLAEVYGEWMLSAGLVAVACRGFDA